MTSLLPDVVTRAVNERSILETTGSFGIVALILLVVVLLQVELARVDDQESSRRVVSAMAGPLFVAVALVIGARFAAFIS
jgi:hypothetical protein